MTAQRLSFVQDGDKPSVFFYICDSEAERPSGLPPGSMGYTKDTNKWWTVGSNNSWSQTSGGGGSSDHDQLTNVTATQHHSNALDHAQNHTDTQHTDGPNSKQGHAHTHAATTGQGPNDHHTAFTQTNHDALANPHHARLHTVTDTLDHTFPGGSTFLRADGVFAAPPGGGGNPTYTRTSFTLLTDEYYLATKRLTLASTDRATIQGTARVHITG